MGKRLIPAILLALLVIFQAQLWLGRGSLRHVGELKARLGAQQQANLEAQARNERLGAEVRDLQEGLEMVEEKARIDLGMVKPNEIFVQVAK
jgi:cell division protein FtsB